MRLTFTIQNLKTHSPEAYLTDKALIDNRMGLYAFIGITADFRFLIEQVCVLQESYWNIGELAMQLNRWLRTGILADFHYDCMEAEEKDLFTFKKLGDVFAFYSEWATENTQTLLTKADLADFITKFSDVVKSSIKQQLNLDADAFLDS